MGYLFSIMNCLFTSGMFYILRLWVDFMYLRQIVNFLCYFYWSRLELWTFFGFRHEWGRAWWLFVLLVFVLLYIVLRRWGVLSNMTSHSIPIMSDLKSWSWWRKSICSSSVFIRSSISKVNSGIDSGYLYFKTLLLF